MFDTRFRRFKITGTLTAISPLRIGSGKREPERIGERDVQIWTIARDSWGPVIPGSALKGILRGLADRYCEGDPFVADLFGTGEKEEERGGLTFFRDAPLDCGASPIPALFRETVEGEKFPLNWDASRFSYFLPGTALNRITRTVQENKLYYREVVPSKAVFRVSLFAEALTDRHLGSLLNLLDKLNPEEGIPIGALGSKGLGVMRWKLDQVRGLVDETDLKTWLANPRAGFEGYHEIEGETLSAIRNASSPIYAHADTVLTLGIELEFEGPFMVHDPSQATEAKEDDEAGTSHVFMKNEDGRVVLRATSFHGALRSQAERIVRTVAPKELRQAKSCHATSRENACTPVEAHSQAKSLCLNCRLFGAGGWKSAVTCSDFSPGEDGEPCEQEFVAIDRFTGGAARKKKFRASYCLKPRLEGTLKLDLSRIGSSHAGLLVLTLRDLIEGDISFGFGRSKGFGRCRARVTSIELPGALPRWVEDHMCFPDVLEDLCSVSQPLSDEQAMSLYTLVESFSEEVKTHAVL